VRTASSTFFPLLLSEYFAPCRITCPVRSAFFRQALNVLFVIGFSARLSLPNVELFFASSAKSGKTHFDFNTCTWVVTGHTSAEYRSIVSLMILLFYKSFTLSEKA
jgi:hypothetical protein